MTQQAPLRSIAIRSVGWLYSVAVALVHWVHRATAFFFSWLQQRHEEGLARIACLCDQIERQEGIASGLAAADASLRQRLAPPLGSQVSHIHRAEGVPLTSTDATMLFAQNRGHGHLTVCN
jgi:hypothetical protein